MIDQIRCDVVQSVGSRNSEGTEGVGARRMRIRATIWKKSDAGLLFVIACKTVVM